MSAILETLSPDEQRYFDEARAADGAEARLPAAPEATEMPEADPAEFARERQQTEQLERQLAEERAQVAAERGRTQAQMDLLNEALQQHQAPQPRVAAASDAEEIPPLEHDPVGHFSKRVALLQQRLDAADAAKHFASMRDTCAQQEQQFQQSNPDYRDAMQHLLNTRHAMLQAGGYTDEALRQQIIANDVANIAQAAMQEGVSFPERLYRMAKAAGFRPATAAPAPDEILVPPSKPRRGHNAAPTAAPLRTTPERAAAMNDREFAQLLERADPATLRQLLGS